MNLLEVAPDRSRLRDVRCPGCGSALILHQPDQELPDRLLATCPGCRSWYVTNGEGEEITALATPGS